MATIAPPQPPPQLNFEITTPQIQNAVFVCVDISDDTRCLAIRATLRPEQARALAATFAQAADVAEKKIIVPMSPGSQA